VHGRGSPIRRPNAGAFLTPRSSSQERCSSKRVSRADVSFADVQVVQTVQGVWSPSGPQVGATGASLDD
jgi:hypothetical protein